MARHGRPANAMDRLVEQLSTLPGIGKRSAERIAFALLKQPPEAVDELAEALHRFRRDLKVCSITGHVSESDPCSIATDPDRDHSVILVVEQPSDVISMEQTGAYSGSYHVLMGRIAPLDAIGPGELNIDGLLRRITAGGIREVILGLNPTLEGDGTALHLTDELRRLNVKVSRLARGLPTGSSVAAVSKAVLSDAIQGRQPMMQ